MRGEGEREREGEGEASLVSSSHSSPPPSHSPPPSPPPRLLQLHLARQPTPSLDYSHCRRAALTSGWRANLSTTTSTANAPSLCAAAAAGVSAVLCAANCECCADDVHVAGGFNGVLLRSPRAHLLSLFSHCHTAHTQNTWRRMGEDMPQYLAEVVLRSTEAACASYCGLSFAANWQV